MALDEFNFGGIEATFLITFGDYLLLPLCRRETDTFGSISITVGLQIENCEIVASQRDYGRISSLNKTSNHRFPFPISIGSEPKTSNIIDEKILIKEFLLYRVDIKYLHDFKWL